MTKIRAPRSNTGAYRALAICGILFLLLLSVETQRFARIEGYQVSELGMPAAGRFYAPWASIGWMLTFDLDPNPFVLKHQREGEARWAHEFFALERRVLLLGGGVLAIAWIALAVVLTPPRRNSDLHGGAGFASRHDLRRSALTQAQYGIVLGQTKTGQLLVHDGEENVLGIGPPGEGKTDGIARPTLLKTWPCWSAIVFDPANELTPLTAAVRAQHTRVVVFDPRDPHTARDNPLAGIAVGDVDAVRTVMAAYLLERDLGDDRARALFQRFRT